MDKNYQRVENSSFYQVFEECKKPLAKEASVTLVSEYSTSRNIKIKLLKQTDTETTYLLIGRRNNDSLTDCKCQQDPIENFAKDMTDIQQSLNHANECSLYEGREIKNGACKRICQNPKEFYNYAQKTCQNCETGLGKNLRLSPSYLKQFSSSESGNECLKDGCPIETIRMGTKKDGTPLCEKDCSFKSIRAGLKCIPDPQHCQRVYQNILENINWSNIEKLSGQTIGVCDGAELIGLARHYKNMYLEKLQNIFELCKKDPESNSEDQWSPEKDFLINIQRNCLPHKDVTDHADARSTSSLEIASMIPYFNNSVLNEFQIKSTIEDLIDQNHGTE